jgi:hypothetical protein
MSFLGYERIKHPDHRVKEGNYSYICAHCEHHVNGLVVANYNDGMYLTQWLLCTNCGKGSVYTYSEIFPKSLFGIVLEGLPKNILKAYTEARNCMSVGAYTACELICRKLLMHVAVDKGAKEDQAFIEYVNHLESRGYVTPPMKDWVDLIRKHGNQATHVLEEPEKERAESTLMFTAELLRLVYEMDYLGKKYTTPKSK